jgi:hypothetical protein
MTSVHWISSLPSNSSTKSASARAFLITVCGCQVRGNRERHPLFLPRFDYFFFSLPLSTYLTRVGKRESERAVSSTIRRANVSMFIKVLLSQGRVGRAKEADKRKVHQDLTNSCRDPFTTKQILLRFFSSSLFRARPWPQLWGWENKNRR